VLALADSGLSRPGPADGRDLGVEALNRQLQAGTTDHDRAKPGRCPGIERVNKVTERCEEIRGGGQQALFAPSVREALDGVAAHQL